MVVPRGDVGIADRPIHRDAFFQGAFKIEIAPAIALAPPGEGLSPNLPTANPGKLCSRGGGIRIVHVADEEFVRVFIASVIDLALDRLRPLALGAIVPAAILELPHGNVLDIVLLRDNGAPGFEDQCVQAPLGQLFGRPTTRYPRTNNDCVIRTNWHATPPRPSSRR